MLFLFLKQTCLFASEHAHRVTTMFDSQPAMWRQLMEHFGNFPVKIRVRIQHSKLLIAVIRGQF